MKIEIEKGLFDSMRKSIRVGYKYYLSCVASIESFREGTKDTPGNSDMRQIYWETWGDYSADAIRLLNKYEEEGGDHEAEDA